MSRTILLLVSLILLLETKAVCQFSFQRPDFPFLARLTRGMTIGEARDSLRGYTRIQRSSDTTLVFEETLFDVRAEISLAFARMSKRLRGVAINFKSTDTQQINAVLRYLKDHHGEHHETSTKEEKKVFVTFEMFKWKLGQGESLVFVVLSRKKEPLGLSILYLLVEESDRGAHK